MYYATHPNRRCMVEIEAMLHYMLQWCLAEMVLGICKSWTLDWTMDWTMDWIRSRFGSVLLPIAAYSSETLVPVGWFREIDRIPPFF